MILAVSSGKGGVGKSTIVCNLAAYFASLGKTVAIFDTDKIASTGNFILYRKEHEGLPLIRYIFSEVSSKMIQTIRDLSDLVDIVLIDLQGSDSGDNRIILTMADTVVFPFGVSQTDLDTAINIKSIVEQLSALKPDASYHFLINAAPTNTRVEENEAKKWLTDLGLIPLTTIIHSRKAFREAMASGRGVTEIGAKAAADEIIALAKEIAPKASQAKASAKPRAPKREERASL